jgi:hypothetical protein
VSCREEEDEEVVRKEKKMVINIIHNEIIINKQEALHILYPTYKRQDKSSL